MKRKLNHSVIVGIFITVGLLILAAAVFILGGQQKTFAKSVTIKAIFDDVNGLQPGNNVWLFGVKVGSIKKITFFGQTKVEVIMNVERDAQSRIHKDATAKISSDGFIGSKIIVINGGTQKAPIIQGGEYIGITVTPSTDEVFVTLQQNNKNLLEITNNLKTVSRKLVNGEGTIGQLLTDTTMAHDIKTAIARFKAVASRSEQVIANVQHFSEGLRKPGTLANELITDTSVFNSVRATVANLNSSSVALQNAMVKVNAVTDSIQMASASLSDTTKPIGMLLNNKQVAQYLKQMAANLASSSQKLDEDLEAAQHNFLLRGFFKKKEKEQAKKP